MSLFRAYREAVCPRAPPSVRMGKGRAGGGQRGRGGRGRVPSCTPLPHGWGREEPGAVCPRVLPFRAYALRPKEEGDWAGRRVPSRTPFPRVPGTAANEGRGLGRASRALACPLSVRTGRRSRRGRAGATCPHALPFRANRAPRMGEGGSKQQGWHALMRPPFRADMLAPTEKGGVGGRRASCARAQTRGGQGALPMRLPIRAQAEARAQRGGAARKRERGGGSPEREEGVNGGPPFPHPCLLCAKTGVGGQKAPSRSRANRGGGARGAGGHPGPRLCILFNVNRGGRRKGAGKGGGPREEAEGGALGGAVRRAATRGGAPPTRPTGHAERGA
ncbi:hypothetical protein EDB85DRAFT_2172216 [Lactarius pseudohatsudake]|nr:hypothetical protein EDB85DRAFT_2172216 [Lactarius pseudohatsudake]